MKNLFTLILSFLTTYNFAQTKTIYLDPSSAIGTSVSQLFSEVKYIPLETTKESAIGSISRMIVTDRLIIILDWPNSAILFFDKSGRFLSKYVDKTNEIQSLELNRFTNSILIQTVKKRYSFTNKEEFELATGMIAGSKYFGLYECSLNNKDTFRFVSIPDFKYSAYKIAPLHGNKFLASLVLTDESFPDKMDYELKVISHNKIEETFFPYNLKRYTPYYLQFRNIAFFNSANDSAIYFTRPWHYEIYVFQNNKISAKFKFVFPLSQTLPVEFLDGDLSTENNREVLRKKYQGVVEEIIPVTYEKNHLLFWLSTLQPNNMLDKKLYLLEINSNTLLYTRKITADSLSYNLPVNLNWTLYGDASGFYSYISAFDLLRAAKNNTMESSKLPSDLKRFLEKNDSKVNPVIIQVISK